MEKICKYFILPILILSPFITAYLIGFDRLFYVVGDTDLALLGEGLAFNSQLSQTFFDHPSYPLYLIIGYWYKFLYLINLSSIYDFDTLLQYQSKLTALEHLIVRLRVLAALINCLYLIVVYFFLKQLTSFTPAIIGLLIAATSQGVMTQSVMLRMEPLSLIFIVIGLIAFTKTISQNEISLFKVYILSCVTATAFYLASITKVTAVLYGLFLIPWIAMLFMERNKAVRPVKSKLDAILILFTCSIGSLYIFELFQHTYNLSNSLKSNLFYAFLLLTYLASTQIFFKSFIVILVQICSIACGISFAFALNFIRYSDKNHFAVVTFIDYIQRFSYSSEEQHISPVPVGTERFFVSIISKLDILWLAHYPIQILLYIAAFFIVKTYSQKKRYLPLAIFLYAIATCILVETLSRLRVIVPENHIYDRSNFDTIVYYKIYTELFIMITVVTSLNYFRTTFGYTRLLKCSLLVMTFICFASIKINIVSLKNDSLNYLSINQTTINACNHATPAKHFYTYLANGFKERTPLKIDLCYEQMDKILKRD